MPLRNALHTGDLKLVFSCLCPDYRSFPGGDSGDMIEEGSERPPCLFDDLASSWHLEPKYFGTYTPRKRHYF